MKDLQKENQIELCISMIQEMELESDEYCISPDVSDDFGALLLGTLMGYQETIFILKDEVQPDSLDFSSVLAFANLKLSSEDIQIVNRSLRLEYIHVNINYRNEGIGSLLLSHVIYKSIYPLTVSCKISLKNFYIKHGLNHLHTNIYTHSKDWCLLSNKQETAKALEHYFINPNIFDSIEGLKKTIADGYYNNISPKDLIINLQRLGIPQITAYGLNN